jgi:hypothetical protein
MHDAASATELLCIFELIHRGVKQYMNATARGLKRLVGKTATFDCRFLFARHFVRYKALYRKQ